MNLHEQLTSAADQAARIVEGTGPDQFDRPTPDTEWDVKTLLNHLVLWTAYSFERRATSAAVGPELTGRDFAAEDGYAAAYRAQLDRALAAWAAPGIWDTEIDTGGGTMPAPKMAEMILMEMVLHGWDLARATGQDFSVPDPVAETALRAVTESAELYRQYDGFKAPAEPGPGAGALECALAVSGRDAG
jgi:uncharacterized protein (TIGR03086 family)